MGIFRFRIQTLMFVVALAGALMGFVVLVQDASPINRMIVLGSGVLLVLWIVVPALTIFLLGILVTPCDRPPPK